MEMPELVQRLSERMQQGGAEPVAHLIVEEMWLAVVEGSLDPGQRLPTARQLAIALGVSPRSIERAYAELERRGVLMTRTGSGLVVSLSQPLEQQRARHRELAKLCRDTVQRANDLGFDIDELLDALGDFRTAAHESRAREP